MPRVKLIISIIIFSFLLSVTSVIKNKTRLIEKKIYKIDKKIAHIEKDLSETELDYSYLSSPKNLSKRIKELSLIDYVPMEYSRIYLNLNDFVESKKKITELQNEKKKK